jgi:hypothetical protein
MVSKLIVICKFLREFVNGKLRLGSSRRSGLDETLDGDRLVVDGVLSEENHSKGAMVEKVDCFITSVIKLEQRLRPT